MTDVLRHQPGGPFQVDHFMSPDDQRTHIERLNPIGDGSPAMSPGCEAAGRQKPVLVVEPAPEAEPVEVIEVVEQPVLEAAPVEVPEPETPPDSLDI